MQSGIVVNAGDPREMAQLAAEAEAAGWDGVFYYDAIAIGDAEMYDPWVVLAAMAMWTGKPFGFKGRHYRFGPMTFRPTPVQRPRIPIWVVGAWPHERSMRRVLRWDGIVTQTDDVAEIKAIAEYVERERPAELRSRPFEIVVQGRTP